MFPPWFLRLPAVGLEAIRFGVLFIWNRGCRFSWSGDFYQWLTLCEEIFIKWKLFEREILKSMTLVFDILHRNDGSSSNMIFKQNKPTTSSPLFSSWSSCGCESSSCFKLCGVCVVAASSQSEWHHQEVHGLLLQPTSHSKSFIPLIKYLE